MGLILKSYVEILVFSLLHVIQGTGYGTNTKSYVEILVFSQLHVIQGTGHGTNNK
jgi:hypothetical protein